MKLGTENKKQVVALAVLGTIAVLALLHEYWPSSTTSTRVSTQTNSTAAGTKVTRRTKSGKIVTVVEPRLDPTLDLSLLKRSEDINYGGNGRNIFVAGSVATIEKPRGTGTTDHAQQAELFRHPPIQPPPPITLKFFGFENEPGEPKKVFLSQGEDVFIAGEGEIVDRRYRVLRIAPNAVEMEDVLNNNHQMIPLTQG
ncbi:MAG: hypothetical protein WA609_19610 [Terriglobales bacterium]